MGVTPYQLLRAGCMVIRHQCINEFVLDREHLDRAGGIVLAATHIGHVEPGILACHTPRQIFWLARIEFFRRRGLARLLKWMGALHVNRAGVPVATIRKSIDFARRGEIVGIFPEGGVKHGSEAAFRGGAIKRGACVIAIRANVPIVPVVVLGTEKLNCVRPWLPGKWAKVWVAYGRPVEPPDPSMHPRAARFAMSERLSQEIMDVYQRLLVASGLSDADVP